MKVINKISEFGNNFFDWLVEGVLPLPGIIKGFLVIVVFLLVLVGILSLLKKSLKIFGIILSIIAIIILCSMLFK
jgi:hypothetical protein